jgi:hypothetical protein
MWRVDDVLLFAMLGRRQGRVAVEF